MKIKLWNIYKYIYILIRNNRIVIIYINVNYSSIEYQIMTVRKSKINLLWWRIFCIDSIVLGTIINMVLH